MPCEEEQSLLSGSWREIDGYGCLQACLPQPRWFLARAAVAVRAGRRSKKRKEKKFLFFLSFFELDSQRENRPRRKFSFRRRRETNPASSGIKEEEKKPVQVLSVFFSGRQHRSLTAEKSRKYRHNFQDKLSLNVSGKKQGWKSKTC